MKSFFLTGFFFLLNVDPLEKAFQENGCDLELAIKKLTDLLLDSTEQSASSSSSVSHQQVEEETSNENLPKDGAGWVELLVGEMASASNIDAAKSRASRLLQVFENTILTRASSDAAQSSRQESEAVKRTGEENNILKQAVVIQYERHKNMKSELARLRRLVTQYRTQSRVLERKNYELTHQMKEAVTGDSIPRQS